MEYVDRLTSRLHITTHELEISRAETEGMRAEHRRLQAELQRMQAELKRSQTEVKRVRAQLGEMQDELDEYEQVGDRVNEQIVQMFSQAQLIAEGMVEDVSHDSRARIEQAREHERKIVEQAVNAAGKHVHEYARSAQAQMQSIMESFAQEVDQLGVTGEIQVVPGTMPGTMSGTLPGASDSATEPPSQGQGAQQQASHRNGAEAWREEG